jgi:hypothetical protein
VTAKKTGTVNLTLSNPDGVCINRSVTLRVVDTRVVNPSFEMDPVDSTKITGWESAGSGPVGLDDNGGAFGMSLVPDGGKVAFMGDGAKLTQPIVALNPGQSYWLQFHYNASAGATSGRLTVKLGDQSLGSISSIAAAGDGQTYYFTNLVFTPPAAGGGLLEFSNETADGLRPD